MPRQGAGVTHPAEWTILRCLGCFDELGAYRTLGAFEGKNDLRRAHKPYCPDLVKKHNLPLAG